MKVAFQDTRPILYCIISTDETLTNMEAWPIRGS